MPQLPFGFDPDAGTFANVKLPPPRVNNRYSNTSSSDSSSASAGVSYQPVETHLNLWERFDCFISDIGNWFADNFDDVVEKISFWLYLLLFAGAVIAVIGVWVSSGFLSAIIAGVVALIVVGILSYVGTIVLPIISGIVMFAGRFIFWNALTFLLFIGALVGGWAHSALRPAATPTQVEATAAPTTTSYTCTASTLNVRSAPDKHSPVMGVLRRGDEVKVLDSTGDFSRIEYNGATGYVATRYIRPVETPASH